MTSVPDLPHLRIVRALERAGFRVINQGKHISMHSEERNVMAVIPRHNPVKRNTLARILRELGMSIQEFRDLL